MKISPRVGALLFGIATAFGLSSTIQSYLLSVSAGDRADAMVGHLIVLNLVYWYVPAIVATLIVRLATRYQFARGQGWTPFAVHITGALTYSVIHSAAMLGGFQIGLELLLINGVLTFLGLLALSRPAGRGAN